MLQRKGKRATLAGEVLGDKDRFNEATTLLRPSVAPASVPGVRYRIRVVAGPGQGLSVDVTNDTPGRLLVGQSPACGLQIPGRYVSRRHAAFAVEQTGLRLTDLGSTNGTFVGRLRVTDVTLRGGEQVQLGESTLQVELPEAHTKAAIPDELRFGRMLGRSLAMRRLYPLCHRLAAADLPVLIEGETGTGKEVLAEALHEAGPRANGPFAVFDCAAVAPSLLESTLFGHEKGAFTGATGMRRGVFEQADGGTLFIDEIGELEPTLQPKLLRAIERSQIQRVGSDRWIQVNSRVIAASRRDMDREVAEGRFRDDLFFRLAVGRLELPPLRERTGDIPLLARHFWEELGTDDTPLPDELLARMSSYPFPGNVRELRNTVARARALGDTAFSPMPTSGSDATSSQQDVIERVLSLHLPLPQARQRVVEEFETRYVEEVLARFDGNVGRAASASGIKRRYFQVLRARYRR